MTRRRFSAKALRDRLREFGDCCADCKIKVGGAAGLEWDHVIPLELFGEDDLSNLQPLCRGCHKAKTKQDVARIAKAKRMEQRTLGIGRQAKRKLPGSRSSALKAKVGGGWERRDA